MEGCITLIMRREGKRKAQKGIYIYVRSGPPIIRVLVASSHASVHRFP